MTVKLDNIELEVSKKLFGKTINIKLNEQTIQVLNDTVSRTVDIIKNNYEKIKPHYISNLSKNQTSNIEAEDLNAICVKILLYYIDQYSRWKEQYKKSNYDIKFYEKDFDHPTTNDIIIFFLQDKYPDKWKTISANYIDMDPNKFDDYWANRQSYFNK